MSTPPKKTTGARTTPSKTAPRKPAAKPKAPRAAKSKATARTTKASAPKTAAPKTAAPKATTPTAPKPKPVVVNRPEPVVVGPSMRKKEIVDKVVLRSGMKKRDVKPVVETLLSVLGEALEEGRELVMPPMGRLRVHKQKKTGKKTIYFAKVHQNRPPQAPTPEAETDDS